MTEEVRLAELLEPDSGAGPVFDEPWQARAFGLVVALHDEGAGFDWQAFQERLIAEIDAADDAMAPQDALEAAYYDQWLAAFEDLLVADEYLSQEEIQQRAEAFANEDRTAEEFVTGDRDH